MNKQTNQKVIIINELIRQQRSWLMFFFFLSFFLSFPYTVCHFFQVNVDSPFRIKRRIEKEKQREREREVEGRSQRSAYSWKVYALFFSFWRKTERKKKKVKTKHNSSTNNTSNTNNSVVGSVGYFTRICLHLVSFSIFFLQSKTLKTR